MPYLIQADDNQYCVYRESEEKLAVGNPIGCHETRAEALTQLRALYANEPESDYMTYRGGDVKSIRMTPDGKTIVGGYLVRFTSPEKKDLDGEYFNSETDFFFNRGHDLNKTRVLYHHGLDSKVGVDVIGKPFTAKVDEWGIWYEAQIEASDEYQAWINKLVEEGRLGWSSGAFPQSVEVSKNGHIKSWAIWEASLTPTPAMPFETGIVPIKTLKKLGLTQEAQAHKGLDSELEDVNERKADTPENKSDFSIRTKNMKPEDMKPEDEKMPEDTAKPDSKADMSRIVAMLEQVLAMLGSTADDDESDAMQAYVEEQIEEGKSVTMERVAELVIQYQNARDADRAKAERKIKGYQALQNPRPPASPTQSQKYGGTSPRVTMGEDLRFAHLSASDMALGFLMKRAPFLSQGMGVKPGDVVSEDYLRTMTHKAVTYAESSPYESRHDRERNFAVKSTLPFKANELDASDIAGQGAEWVGEFWSTDLWRKERFERHFDVLQNKGMLVTELPKGTDTGYFPTEGSDPVAYVAPQANSIGADGRPETTVNINPFGTGRVSVTPTEIKIATSFTVILDEDSIISVAPQVNRQLRESALDTRDKLLVNGDTVTSTTNINYDGTTVPSGLSTPYYIASDGFRKSALVTYSADRARDASNTLSVRDFLNTMALLDGEQRQYRDRMVFMIDPDTELAVMDLLEVRTSDVYTPAGTIQGGRVSAMYGVDLISNGFLPVTDADGKVTATGNAVSRGTILVVYAPYWGFAYKRAVTLETERDIFSGTNNYVMSMRIGMVARGSNASAITYNVSQAIS